MDITVYENKRVIIWGSGYFGFLSHLLLYKLDIEVEGFCDNDGNKWGEIYCEKPIFSPKEVETFSLEKEKNLLIVIAVEQGDSLRQQVEDMNLSCEITSIDAYELKHSGGVLYKEILKANPSTLNQEGRDTWAKEVLREESVHEATLISRIPKKDYYITVCQPPKTGDNTLLETMGEQEGHIWNTCHKPHLLDHNHLRPKKITAAIREPIARDLSLFYQFFGRGDFLSYGYSRLSEIIALLEEDAINPLFYKGHERPVVTRKQSSLQRFYEGFAQYAVDVLDYDFDKEKGYTIIKTDEVEVFMFQLEKLNGLLPELSQWSGMDIPKLVNKNVASDKWIADSYEKSKKNLTFSKEYFDLCFEDPYIQHCYSQEDIEQFKTKWRGHIR